MLKLLIEGMTCNHCAMHVKKALSALPGVESAEVDLPGKQAIVQGPAAAEALIAAVEAEGYSARLG